MTRPARATSLTLLREASDHERRRQSELNTGSDVEIAADLKARLEERHARLIRAHGSLYRYDRTHWSVLATDELRREVHAYDGRTYGLNVQKVVKLNRSRVDSILNEMFAMFAEPDPFAAAPPGVNCANGFVQLDKTGQARLSPHHPDHLARHVLSAEWNPSAGWRRAPLLWTLLEGCFCDDGDKTERIDLVSEVLGATLLGWGTRLAQPQAVILHGACANNGKSQILECARALLPREVVTSVSPSAFGESAMLAKLAGAHLNTTSELGSAEAVASDVFKSVVTGDPITARRKYENPFEFRPTAQHLFATNDLPRFKGGIDRGVRRRLIVLPFRRSIPPTEMIPNIGARVALEEPGALLNFAIEGAARLLKNGRYSAPPSCAEALNEWVRVDDPVAAWVADETEYLAGARYPVKEAYGDLGRWATAEGMQRDELPKVNIFVRKLMSDPRLSTGKSDKQRWIVGLRARRS